MKKLFLLAALLGGSLTSLYGISWNSTPDTVGSGVEYTISVTADNAANFGAYTADFYLFKNYALIASYTDGGYATIETTSTDNGVQSIGYFAQAFYWLGGSGLEESWHYVDIVQSNVPPTIAWVQNPGSAAINEWFPIQARGNDSDGNLVSVSVWREGVPHAFDGGGNGYENYSDPNLSYLDHTGDVTFSAQATDSNGATSDMIYHTVHVYDRPPTIEWSHVQATAFVNQSFVIQAHGTDPDGNLGNVNVWKGSEAFAIDGGGNGYENYTDWNATYANWPGSITFWAESIDNSGEHSGWISHTIEIQNRAPYNAAISASGPGVGYNSAGMHYTMNVGDTLTIAGHLQDDDSNLAYHAITKIGPGDTNWVLISGTTPSGAAVSDITTTFTPLVPGRYDFNTNGHDGTAWGPGASITVYAYGPINNAQFLSQTGVPSTINTGQTVQVTVTMRNNGEKQWTTDATPHRLGSVNDSNTWGLNRVALPYAPVNPLPQTDSDASFTFNITAPNVGGVYPFQWRMVEDGIQWFGDASTLTNITVVDNQPPSAPTVQLTGKTIATISFSWTASTDNSGVIQHYKIYRNGSSTPLATTTGLAFTDTNLSSNTAYTYTVRAFDGTNLSPLVSQSTIQVTTDRDPFAGLNIHRPSTP